jgi:hypothetical protein
MQELLKERRDAEQLTYKALARRLEKLGVKKEDGDVLDAIALANRINRGNFSAGFAIAVLLALGCSTLTLYPPTKRLKVTK